MDTTELLKKVRKIEIKTRGLSAQIFSGEYHSAFKGRGMAFSEVREYTPGDDIRTIDWNVTARLNTPYVKVFEEERELNVMILVDVSHSGNFGTHIQTKKEIITEICAVLAFSASTNNDKIGVIFFSDKIEKYIPPKKGKTHILRIIRELLNFEPQNKGTNIALALKFLTNAIKKKSIAFVLSDFIDDNYFEDALKIANRKHDVVALRVIDKTETHIPNVGLIKMKDNETGKTMWVDTASKSFQKKMTIHTLESDRNLKNTLSRAGVDYTSIHTGESYIRPLLTLFKKR